MELREHQAKALKSLEEMRANSETIALLYHATGTGKTVTAVIDVRHCGGRTLFLAHTQELVNQATQTSILMSKCTCRGIFPLTPMPPAGGFLGDPTGTQRSGSGGERRKE